MTTTTQTEASVQGQTAERALLDRGVRTAADLAARFDAELVVGWCEWWDRQHGVGPGVLVEAIRSGERPPSPSRDSRLDKQYAYLLGVLDWLRTKLPAVCVPDPKVIAADRRCYGDPSADRLAADTSPHPAAIAAVIRLHHRDGKLTVKRHGPEIRAAVKAFDARAIADYRAIIARRAAEPASPLTTTGQENPS